MRFARPSHPTVVAYAALFVALGGTGYALSEVGSREITNNSVRSKDLRDEHGVTGRDVRDDKLTGNDVRERALDATELAAVAHSSGACDPSSSTPAVCAATDVDLAQPSTILLLGSGGFYSEGGPARAVCDVRIGDRAVGFGTPGEVADNTASGAADGFTVTGVIEAVRAGRHSVALACGEVLGDARISDAAIAAVALGANRID